MCACVRARACVCVVCVCVCERERERERGNLFKFIHSYMITQRTKPIFCLSVPLFVILYKQLCRIYMQLYG